MDDHFLFAHGNMGQLFFIWNLEVRVWDLIVPSGRSAAWLARLPWEQEVGRSNRLAPTIFFKRKGVRLK